MSVCENILDDMKHFSHSTAIDFIETVVAPNNNNWSLTNSLSQVI
jgi:hypothetical protein